MEFQKRKYLQLNECEHLGYAYFDGIEFAPKNFKEKREAAKEYLDIERELIEKGYRGWIGWTTVGNKAMILIMYHVNARCYHVDGDKLWFKKELKPKQGEKYVQEFNAQRNFNS